MNIIHCRDCQAANETTAKYCRDCGAAIQTDLNNALEEAMPSLNATGKSRVHMETKVVSIPLRETTALEKTNTTGSLLNRFFDQSSSGVEARLSQAVAEGSNGVGASAIRQLARASGLSDRRPMRTLAAGLALLLTFCAWLIYRDQSQASSENNRSGLNLVGADETSNRLMMAGENLRDRGDFEGAISQFKESLKLTPNNAKAQSLLARTYNAMGRVDEALQIYSRLLDLDPRNLEARLQRADIYRVRGNWSEAAREYRKIIELDPGSEQAQAALDAIEKPTTERASNYSMLPTMRRRPDNRAGIKYLPPPADHSRVSLPMAELAPNLLPSPLAGNTVNETESEAELAAYRNSIAQTYKNRGNRLSEAGRYADAIRAYQNAQRYTPDDDDLHYLMGTAFFKSGQYSVALDNYRKCKTGTYAAVAKNSVKRADEEARRLAKKQAKQKN